MALLLTRRRHHTRRRLLLVTVVLVLSLLLPLASSWKSSSSSSSSSGRSHILSRRSLLLYPGVTACSLVVLFAPAAPLLLCSPPVAKASQEHPMVQKDYNNEKQALFGSSEKSQLPRHQYEAVYESDIAYKIDDDNLVYEQELAWTKSEQKALQSTMMTTAENVDCRHYLSSTSILEEDLLLKAISQSSLLCSSSSSSSNLNIAETLLRGAFLRISSDLSGGIVFESIKVRVTTSKEGPIEACNNIVKDGGVLALWTGTQARIIEGALIGAVYMLASSLTKTQIQDLGDSPTFAALVGGLAGGIAQAIVMTPAGMIFTSLNYNRGKEGYENDNVVSVTKRILKEKGIVGMYYGGFPMTLRQATNWASRSGLTEFARTTLNMSQYGILGEIGSGIIGGLGSCWNTPIEAVRIITQRDLSSGQPTKSMTGYWKEIIDAEGFRGLFRGIAPRALQAIWQTCFLVVVPNLMGM